MGFIIGSWLTVSKTYSATHSPVFHSNHPSCIKEKQGRKDKRININTVPTPESHICTAAHTLNHTQNLMVCMIKYLITPRARMRSKG